MLHVTNGDCARVLMERSGMPGTFLAWPDVLHEGPTPLASGDEWIKVRDYLAFDGSGTAGAEPLDDVIEKYGRARRPRRSRGAQRRRSMAWGRETEGRFSNRPCS